jgi:hypothetical protein
VSRAEPQELPDGSRVPDLAITRGGVPSPEQLAALTVALSATRPAGTADDRPPLQPAWTRAALLEGIGARIVEDPSQLTRLPAIS